MPFNTWAYPWRRSGFRRWRSPSPLRLRRRNTPPKNTMRTRIMGAMPIMARFRQIVVHAQPVPRSPVYVWGPVGAVGSVVGGTGQAVGAVFYGAGGIVGGIVGGVVGGVSALFGGPGYSYTPATGYGGPFAAPFNAAGGVAEAPFQVVGGAFGGTPPASAAY